MINLIIFPYFTLLGIQLHENKGEGNKITVSCRLQRAVVGTVHAAGCRLPVTGCRLARWGFRDRYPAAVEATPLEVQPRRIATVLLRWQMSEIQRLWKIFMRQTSAKVERNMHWTLGVFFIEEQMWQMLSKAEYIDGIEKLLPVFITICNQESGRLFDIEMSSLWLVKLLIWKSSQNIKTFSGRITKYHKYLYIVIRKIDFERCLNNITLKRIWRNFMPIGTPLLSKMEIWRDCHLWRRY